MDFVHVLFPATILMDVAGGYRHVIHTGSTSSPKKTSPGEEVEGAFSYPCLIGVYPVSLFENFNRWVGSGGMRS